MKKVIILGVIVGGLLASFNPFVLATHSNDTILYHQPSNDRYTTFWQKNSTETIEFHNSVLNISAIKDEWVHSRAYIRNLRTNTDIEAAFEVGYQSHRFNDHATYSTSPYYQAPNGAVSYIVQDKDGNNAWWVKMLWTEDGYTIAPDETGYVNLQWQRAYSLKESWSDMEVSTSEEVHSQICEMEPNLKYCSVPNQMNPENGPVYIGW